MTRFGTRTRRSLALGTVLLAVQAGGACAADVTPEQKASLEAVLRSWYTAVGPAFLSGAEALRVTPEGDRFGIAAPLRLSGPVRGEIELTGKALPREAGRWRFEDVRTTSPFKLTVDMPMPESDGDKKPGAKATPRTMPVTYTGTIAEQNNAFDYDPSFRTPVRYDSSFKGLTLDAAGDGVAQRSAVEAGKSYAAITPTGPDGAKLDFDSKGELTGYTIATRIPNSTGTGDAAKTANDLVVDIRRIAVAAGLNGLDRAQGGKLLEALVAIGNHRKGPGKSAEVPRPLREMLAASVRGLASDLAIAEDFEQIKVSTSGVVFAFDKARFGMGGNSKDGLVRAALEMGYDGLAMPDMGFGFEELVPRRAVLRPYVANLSAEGLSQLLATATSDKSPEPNDFTPLFARGPVVAGVDGLALDIAGTVFTGEGAYTMTSPRRGTGKARIVAENLDGLIQKLNGQPMAQQAVPVVVFLKGIGKADGGKLVWDIDFDGAKVLVNGLDMTAMAGGTPKGPAPRR